MKKHISKIVLLFIFVAFCFSLSGCVDGNDSNGVSPSGNPNLPTMEKHVVTITTDNYLKYIEVSTSSSYGQTSYYFEGCLSYAFYDVSFTMSYSTSSLITDIKTEIVNCNAAGNGTFSGGGKYSAKIEAVSGTVIYWI